MEDERDTRLAHAVGDSERRVGIPVDLDFATAAIGTDLATISRKPDEENAALELRRVRRPCDLVPDQDLLAIRVLLSRSTSSAITRNVATS